MISVQPRSLSFYTLRISLVGRIYSSIMTPHDEVLSNHDVHTIIEYKSCPPSFTHEPRTEHLPLSQPWMEFPKIDPSHPFVYKRRGLLLLPTHTSPSSFFLHFLQLLSFSSFTAAAHRLFLLKNSNIFHLFVVPVSRL
jgi:hypothetical protein